jgi:hypothetical protein
MPRSSTPLTRAPCATSPRSSTYGAAASTCGIVSTRARTARQSGNAPSSPDSVACDAMARMRSLSSRSKPFMTASTVSSTATPTAMPSTPTAAMNDRKPLSVRARR